MQDLNKRQLLKSGVALAALGAGLGACSNADQRPQSPAPANDANGTSPAASPVTAIPDATEMLRQMRAGETTSLALTEAAIERARSVNPKINAIATETFDTALEQAANPPSGPLGGLPSFIKDLQDWAGAPTLYGSRAFRGNLAATDGPFQETWRAAGIISLGKSTTPEMGLISSTEPLVTGPTRNPWDLSRIPGGSSGGAAALVAARVVPFAHASDGGGSIRIPAAACGLVGHKPSRGAFPQGQTEGLVISVQHCVSLTVRDSALVFAATERPAPDLSPVGLVSEPVSRRLRIAFQPEPNNGGQLDTATRQGIERTAQLCRDIGHDVIDWTMPIDGEVFTNHFLLLWAAGAAEFAQAASAYSGQPPSPDILEPWTLGLAAEFIARQADFPASLKYLKDFQARYESFFDGFDVILSPTVSTVPPKIGSQAPDGDYATVRENVVNYAAFTAPMNVAGAPAISLPLQWSEEGLPVGSMFAAKRGDDRLLLELALELEQAQPWIDRLPPLA